MTYYIRIVTAEKGIVKFQKSTGQRKAVLILLLNSNEMSIQLTCLLLSQGLSETKEYNILYIKVLTEREKRRQKDQNRNGKIKEKTQPLNGKTVFLHKNQQSYFYKKIKMLISICMI